MVSSSPDPIPAPPGTYFHFNSFVELEVTGSYLNPLSGNTLPFGKSFSVATINCADPDTSCAFERTVLAPVPIPAAVWLFGSGGHIGAPTYDGLVPSSITFQQFVTVG
jgi:hypothetical protein